MTSPIHQFPNQLDAPTAAPFSPLKATVPDSSVELPNEVSTSQLKHWQEELQYIQWENEQILMLYQLHLNYKDHSAKRAASDLSEILQHQLPYLQKVLNQMQTNLQSNRLRSDREILIDFRDMQGLMNELKAQFRPLKQKIIQAMVNTLPLAIM